MDKIAVVDFGGQYTHLIANRIRRLGVYSEIVPPDTPAENFKVYKGIILSGSPHSVIDKGSPLINSEVLSLGIPVLGLCYGHQLIGKILGGSVAKGKVREYGIAELEIIHGSPLFKGLSEKEQIWMSHGDTVDRLPEGFSVFGHTPDCPYAAIGNVKKKIYGLQFHPEVTDTPRGMEILSNFIAITNCRREWNPQTFFKEIAENIRKTCAGKKVFLLVSGGVDSTVTFTLLNKILGADRVLGMHIDNGLMRHGESDDIIGYLKKHGFDNLHIFNASAMFLYALKGVTSPEEKRIIIGNQFIAATEAAQKQMNLNTDEWILAQGTIYPDTIESAGTTHSDKIKTHHNRVDIILELIEKGLIIEPLALLYKDEVRQLGETIGLPRDLLWRHPFPGPGLGVRVLCSPTTDTSIESEVEQKVSAIAESFGYRAYILPVKSVGVQGDSRTYARPALVVGPLDWQKLEQLSTKITNSVRAINRVVYGLAVADDPRYCLIKAFLTRERLDNLRAIDHCVTTILHETAEYDRIWQMPVVLLPLVNACGRECVVLRPITSREAMTARFFPLQDKTLQKIVDSAKNISGIGDIFFDVTHKPPATIEWE